MEKIAAMRVYQRVVELTSFTGAADSLGMSKGKVSSAVQQLEAMLGTRLLQRTTRKVNPTHDGLTYYERCLDVLADLDEMESLFQQSATNIAGRLRVDMPIGLTNRLVVPRLPEFLTRYPAIEIELSSTDRRVDLVREGFDCVLRVGAVGDTTLIARHIGELRIVTCASPGYLATHGIPSSVEHLKDHQLIHYVSHFGAKSSGWEYWDGEQFASRTMKGAVTVNNSEAYVGACLAGLGLIQAPLVGMRKYLEEGRLLEVLANYKAEPMPVYLLYANRRHLPKRVRLFMEWVVELVKEYCE